MHQLVTTLRATHFGRMPPDVAALVEDEESLDPGDVRLFGGPSVMEQPQLGTDSIHQFHGVFARR